MDFRLLMGIGVSYFIISGFFFLRDGLEIMWWSQFSLAIAIAFLADKINPLREAIEI